MRIDVVSIFPDYLAPLELSLIGKAREAGLLDVRVHDLRDFTTDRHRTVDDTPYGGGAGMVMTPQPWSGALRAVAGQGPPGLRPHLLVPGPGGVRFDQAMARRLAREPWLTFACGRYEGIDERVYEHAREDLGLEVTVVSLGDYVLGGGEAAVLAIVEAVTRLVPGVLGNTESLLEESHEDGLLEYPVYTRPSLWQGREVPGVLLSGDHQAIARWRHAQRLTRTAARRPDLLHAAQADAGLQLRLALPADVPELFTLTRACWVQEAQSNNRLDIPALTEDLEAVRASLDTTQTWVARRAGRLIGSVRTELRGDELHIGRLMVAPDLQGQGLGRLLLEHAERTAPDGIREYRLLTGAKSGSNLRRYRRAGYRPTPGEPAISGTVELVKHRRDV